MRLYKYILLSLFCLIQLLQTGHCQEYGFENYSLNKGLPQSEVYPGALAIDHSGIIWAGTNGGGLARLDGKNFKTYTQKEGLISNQIWQVFHDHKHRVWAAGFTKGISCFDGVRFKNYTTLGSIEPSTGLNLIQFKENKSNDLVLFITDQTAGFEFLKLKDDSVFVSLKEIFLTQTQNAIPLSIVSSIDKGIVVNTNKGIYNFDNNNFTPLILPNDERFQGGRITYVYQEKNSKNIWLREVTPQGNVYWIFDGKTYRNPFEGLILPFPNAFQNFNSMLQATDGSYWFVVFGVGVVHLQDGEFEIFDRNSGFSLINFTGVVEDNEGNIWLSTNGAGIHKIQPRIFTHYSRKSGLEDEVIFVIKEDSLGSVWFGSTSGYIQRMQNGKISTLFDDKTQIVNRVSHIHFYQGRVLVSTYNLGLVEYKNGNINPINAEFGLPNAFTLSRIFEDETYLVFCTIGRGLYFYDKKSRKTINISNSNGLSDNATRDIFKDSEGKYWVTGRKGLSCINADLSPHKIFDGKEYFGDNLCMQIEMVGNKALYIATYGSGISVFDGKSFSVIDMKRGLSSDIVYSILKDNENTLWVGTQKGIDRIYLSPEGKIISIQNFNKQMGLNTEEVNGNAISKDSKGNIWFGHLGGVVKINPRNIIKNTVPPKTIINSVQLFLEETPWSDSTMVKYYESLEPWTEIPKGLVLPYNKNSIEFEFWTTSIKNPHLTKFQWKLEPLHEDWLPITSKNSVNFSNLEAGTYTFHVRSMNDSEVWGDPSVYTFKINPHITSTIGFKIAIALVIIIVLYTGYRIRVRAIEEHKKELERIVQIRTAEVLKKQEEILMKNAELEQQKEEILAQHEEIETQNKAILHAHSEINEQHSNIKASIVYAKRIQDAMLPTFESISSQFDDVFILHLPRDVVSGDFYWFHSDDRYVYFSAIDCTGHGVPGAFMSMAADAYLNQIIKMQAKSDPSQILMQLNQNIRHALKQDDNSNRDGMDMGLWVWDKYEGSVMFSGAKIPLIWIYNGEQQVIKADKNSIGGEQLKENEVFHTFTIKLSEYPGEHSFYLFSDGYQDQFGGPENKKFMSRNFRNLIQKVHPEPMKVQKDILLETLLDWRGGESQLDDILVLGMKIHV